VPASRHCRHSDIGLLRRVAAAWCREGEDKLQADEGTRPRAPSTLGPALSRRGSRLSVLGLAVPGSIVALIAPQLAQPRSKGSKSASTSKQSSRVTDQDTEMGMLPSDVRFAPCSTQLATLGDAILTFNPSGC
jgi:hypothetical protein